MSLKFDELKNASRLLTEADLSPLQVSRFQPTGFPDLGAATYTLHDGTEMCLVESAQSMANRLEAVCWDTGKNKLVDKLDGMPYVAVNLPDGQTTNSILEAHRLNSAYIVNSKEFETVRKEVNYDASKPFDRTKMIKALLKYDPACLLHGIFWEKIGGVVRLPRALSATIEAKDVRIVSSGGVKFDRVNPGSEGSAGEASEGYKNIPFHRDEYTAAKITAYFSLDLAQIRGYGLDENVQNFLVALSLYKIQKFLQDGLRLRTACDLEVKKVTVTRPAAYEMPSLASLEEALPSLISGAKGHFAETPITIVKFVPSKSKKEVKEEANA
jgi:CRISPR-associated protein Csb1